MGLQDDILSGLVLELRRGIIVLSVLSQLYEPQYGYSLVQNLETKGMILDAGTLYPLLRRLEKQDLLISEWETAGAKPRKYYVLSDSGKQMIQLLWKEWNSIVQSMEKMRVEQEEGGENESGNAKQQ